MSKLKRCIIFLFTLLLCGTPAALQAQVNLGVSIRVGPPILPIYTQPPCPTPGFLWSPGYWAYAPDGYYWVPGVWVRAPRAGLLWTPGYWDFDDGAYVWHHGYWGRHVGFYGGVDYGYGYTGSGFIGGMWEGDRFRYNTAVVNVDRAAIHDTYVDRAALRDARHSRFSFNGPGGVRAVPTAAERTAMTEPHVERTPEQVSHQETAARNPVQNAHRNHGAPPVAAMDAVNGRSFNQHGAVARGAAAAQPANRATRANPARPTAADTRAPHPAHEPNATSATRRTEPAAQAKTTARPTTRAERSTASTHSRRGAAANPPQAATTAIPRHQVNGAVRRPAEQQRPAAEARPAQTRTRAAAPAPARREPVPHAPASERAARPLARPAARPAARPNPQPQHESAPRPQSAPAHEAEHPAHKPEPAPK